MSPQTPEESGIPGTHRPTNLVQARLPISFFTILHCKFREFKDYINRDAQRVAAPLAPGCGKYRKERLPQLLILCPMLVSNILHSELY